MVKKTIFFVRQKYYLLPKFEKGKEC